jgi:hypothetical protein
MAESASRKTALGGVFDEEYQFVHFVRANRPLTSPTMSSIRRSLSRILSMTPSGSKLCYAFVNSPVTTTAGLRLLVW